MRINILGVLIFLLVSINSSFGQAVVALSPSSANLYSGQTQQFSASVSGSSNTAVTWSITPPGIGIVSNTGLYTTPAAIPTSQTVIVKATSVADPSKSASASVLLSPLTISISPSSANHYAGQTQQFNASIQKSTNTNVNWSISPTGTGSISATGLYSAPSAVPSATTVTVTAASAADPTKTVSASVALSALTISISPSSANRYAGQTQQFNASIQKSPNTNVNWSISPAGTGSISATGLYTAPSAVPSATTVTVTAASAADPTKTVSASVALSALTMSISPQSANLNAGQTEQFSAQVNQNTITAVTWTINPNVGTIGTSGLYTAPAILGSQRAITVTATSVADQTKSLSSTVTLLSPVSVSPSSATLSASQTQQFTATVTGLGNTAVTWSASPSVGSISNTGLYTAPASVTASQTVTIIATSVSDATKKAGATVTLNPPVAITVTPATATLVAAQQQQFTATVTGSTNTAVTWAINPAGTGTITAAGLYTAPTVIAAQTAVTITATSSADTTKTATAALTLKPPVAITVSPATSTLVAGQTQQFTAIVTGSTNTAVTWTITPTGIGTLTVAGLYTAPASITSAQTVTVIATSAADATKSANATVSLLAGSTSLSISNLSPAVGIPGTAVTITGSNFGASQDASTVTFNGASAGLASTWSANSIVVTVPQGATTGNVIVTVNGAASNAVSFGVPPSIFYLSSNSGPVGTLVTITGANFGASQGANTVTFNGVSGGTAISWSDASIKLAAPIGATTGNVVVSANGLASAGKLFAIPAKLLSVSPTSGAAGVQVTISGSGFGSVQGSGSVWLGSTRGAVVSWSDTQVVATVAANSTSGSAQVQQGGVWSNAAPFSVATATISGISPAVGVPGTVVTISGSNFGAAQASGQVWLGNAYGVVQSWSPTQIVAQVAPSAVSGDARVLQNGVWTPTLPFTVNSISLADVSPVVGSAGTQVTFSGSGFAAAQGSGLVWLGSAGAQVISWSDTQIVAMVAPGAVTGVARVQQGVWSKAFSFTVPGGTGTVAMISPSIINMGVGDTAGVEALSAAGKPVTVGLTWTSSDPAIVSLSTANPPVLTALAVGRATILAGGASADVTVTAGPLQSGSTVWSLPGNASYLVPAVPSETGLADVFAVGGSTVKAITMDGTVAWTANVNPAIGDCGATADFQGGLIMNCDFYSIFKLDGLTGQAYPAYTNSRLLNDLLVHPDGTLFNSPIASPGEDHAVLGIDPITGTQKFSIPLVGTVTLLENTNILGGRIIAGDGYAYFPYATSDIPSSCGSTCYSYHLKLLRVSTSGASNVISVADWRGDGNFSLTFGLITNADTGVVLTFKNSEGPFIATTSGTSVSVVGGGGQAIPGQTALYPLLQAQDGTFVGIAEGILDSTYRYSMTAFDANGNIRWSVPNEVPQSATVDGGVMGSSGITYDQNGTATGRSGGGIQSWSDQTYLFTEGQVSSAIIPLTRWANSYQAMAGGNPSSNGTAVGVAQSTNGVHAFALRSRGPTCRLPEDGSRGSQVPLAGPALVQYNQKRNALLVGNYLTSETCSTFFNSNFARSTYFGQLTDAVTRQIPYDGLQSTISRFDAGITIGADLVNPEWVRRMKNIPVCGSFVPFRNRKGSTVPNSGITTAVSQAYNSLGEPAKDVYINTNPRVFTNGLAQATVLHEALHNLTGRYDWDPRPLYNLQAFMSLQDVNCPRGSVCITEKLFAVGCAGSQ